MSTESVELARAMRVAAREFHKFAALVEQHEQRFPKDQRTILTQAILDGMTAIRDELARDLRDAANRYIEQEGIEP